MASINTNVDSLKSYRSLTTTNRKNEKVMEKLSSGLKINRAADDSAGLCISTRMRAQIRGLAQDERNIDDGISMFNVAEGGMAQVEGMVHRIRELSVQSANDANTDEDRQKLQDEVSQLIKGIDRIAHDTEFNTHKVLLGKIGMTSTTVISSQTLTNVFISGRSFADSISTGVSGYNLMDIANNANSVNSLSNFTIRNADGTAVLVSTAYDNLDTYVFASTKFPPGFSNFRDFMKNMDPTNKQHAQYFIDAIAGAMNTILTNQGFGSYANIKGYVMDDGKLGLHLGNNYRIVFGGCTNQAVPSIAHNYIHNDFAAGGMGSISVPSTSTVFSETSVPVGYVIQVGANQDQNVLFEIPPMLVTMVGTMPNQTIDKADVTTQAKADATIAICDEAIKYVSDSRAQMGAHINRLEHAKASATNYHLNISGAESRLRDADMSKEIMEQVKGNILQQSATAMLAQSNQKPQNILQLFR